MNAQVEELELKILRKQIDEKSLKPEDFLGEKLYKAIYYLSDPVFRTEYINKAEAIAKELNQLDAFKRMVAAWEEWLADLRETKKEQREVMENRKAPVIELPPEANITELSRNGILPPLNNNTDLIQTMYSICLSDIFLPVKTGCSFYDDITNGGLRKQSLTFLLARSGSGKTTLCQQLACCIASKGIPVLYYNFEMSREQLIAKDLSRFHNKTCDKMGNNDILTAEGILKYSGYNNEDTKQKIDKLFKDYEPINRFLKYNPSKYLHQSEDELYSYSIENINREITALAELYKAERLQAPVVFIDYLQLIQSEYKDIQEAIKKNVIALKEYAIRYNTAVYVISAVSREAQKNDTLNITSGRDSSNIEYTGDNIIIMDYLPLMDKKLREEKYSGKSAYEIEEECKKPNTREMRLKLVKNRFGNNGLIDIDFYADKGYFVNHNRFRKASKEEQITFKA